MTTDNRPRLLLQTSNEAGSPAAYSPRPSPTSNRSISHHPVTVSVAVSFGMSTSDITLLHCGRGPTKPPRSVRTTTTGPRGRQHRLVRKMGCLRWRLTSSGSKMVPAGPGLEDCNVALRQQSCTVDSIITSRASTCKVPTRYPTHVRWGSPTPPWTWQTVGK